MTRTYGGAEHSTQSDRLRLSCQLKSRAAVNIEWAPRAVDELAQLRDYIAQDSPFYARQFTERLVLAVERLATLSRSGRAFDTEGPAKQDRRTYLARGARPDDEALVHCLGSRAVWMRSACPRHATGT